MKFDVIIADPPWSFSDGLKMSKVKRGSESNYQIMTDDDIKNLSVEKITKDDAILILWVPSSKLQEGLDTMKSWGFEQKQTFVWVKTKKEPLSSLFKSLNFEGVCSTNHKENSDNAYRSFQDFDLNNILNFFMGRLFRQTHELALIGTKGKIYSKLENKAQRSVLLNNALKHSAKPEGLQDRIDLMFPKAKKLELFARRDRPKWKCVGNECPSSLGEDIRVSLERLLKAK